LAAAPGLLDTSWNAATVTKTTYTYAYTTNPSATAATGYCTTAKSTDTSAKSYAVSSGGTIWQADGNTITCDPADGTMGGTNAMVKGGS
jgi:hypothetical protein